MQEKNLKLYSQLKEIYKNYTSDERLDEMHHNLSSQKNESMNRSIMKYAPKHICFGKSTSLFTRIALAVGINSVGQAEMYKRIFSTLGIKSYNSTDIYFKKEDTNFQKHSENKLSASTRRTRAARKSQKWRDELTKSIKDANDGKTYQQGIGIASAENNCTATTVSRVREGTVGNTRGQRCRCGSSTHLRTNNSQCRLNKKRKTMDDEHKDSENQVEGQLCNTTDTHTEKRTKTHPAEDSAEWDNLPFS